MSNGILQSGRARLESDRVRELSARGTLLLDERGRRPRFFDGRFLAARDLTREQNYFLTRQASLGRILGTGVVEGLGVRATDNGRSVTIEPGLGVTSQGEMVALAQRVTVDLADVTEIQTLDAAFGLSAKPTTPARVRTGLFVIGLRAVEFTANPIASYPTRIEGPRSVEDGDIVEAVAVTLVPFADLGSRDELEGRRSEVARRVFVEQTEGGVPAGVFPIAMVAMNRGLVLWMDEYLVRRDLAPQPEDRLGLGLRNRALSEAHVHHYRGRIEEILAGLPAGSGARRFGASEHFRVLPPVGPLPVEAVGLEDFSQVYFPPEIDVELSIIPEDEVAPLVERSLNLPPIDLTLEPEQLESTAVLILVPVPRPMVRRLGVTLDTLRRPLRPGAPGLLARRKPLETLRGLRLPVPRLPVLDPGRLQDSAWAEAFENTPGLWFVRRRNLQHKADLVGIGVRVVGDENDRERLLNDRITDLRLSTRFNALMRRGTAAADAEIVATLGSPAFADSRVLMEGAVSELEAMERVDRVAVLRVSERFSEPEMGRGLRRLETANPVLAENQVVARSLAASGASPELDRLGHLIDDASLPSLAAELETEARNREPEALGQFIRERLEEVSR